MAPLRSVTAAAALLVLVTGCAATERSGLDRTAAEASGGTGASAAVPPGVAAQYATVQKEIAAEGGEKVSGEWNIAYIVEPAEPWYETRDGKQVFRPVAAGETHHLEIVPREASTGRIVPDAPVTLEVVAEDGSVVDREKLELIYAEFFHYAGNFSVPQEGTYTLRATVGTPTFLRHGDEGDKPALAEGVTVSFPNVKLEHDGEGSH